MIRKDGNDLLRFFLLLASVFVLTGNAQPSCSAEERELLFESRIRPLLLDRCVECHGPQKQESGLRFDRRMDVLLGNADGVPLVQPGSPAESRLFQVLRYADDDVQMPPVARLPAEQLAFVQQWIADGAHWPETSNLEDEARSRAERWQQHWAFQPPVSPELSLFPADLHPVDAMFQQRLAENRLQPSHQADARTLVRRLSYALTGLPPEAVDYQAAAEAEAQGHLREWCEAWADQLLASPRFGERWGRYWLDVARYSDTKGYVFQEDREYAEAWKYREWVIRSLNDDMPYDEFLQRQLSADRMPGAEDGDSLAAMGFLTLGRRFLNNKHDIIDDRIDVTTRGMMGLTASCARCHDHKFDPIPTADYYSLYGVFDSSDEPKNEPSTLRLVDRDKPTQPVIFVRGQPGNRGDRVPRRFLSALSGPDAGVFEDGSGRLELARAIASADNPLTGRVAVNRIWMHLFGRGLVDSPSDFGVRTDPPTHPELLDYLTVWFIENQWSTKSLIRQLVTSSTYLQSSADCPDAREVDPENRLLARMPRRRLDFEAHRDSLLAVSGNLDRTVGGLSADITSGSHGNRRTIYARIDRQNLPGIFRTFDLANPDAHAPRRFETTIPQQALYQLNSEFVMEQAEAVAARISAHEQSSESRIAAMFLGVLGREPVADEVQAAVEFLSAFSVMEPESSEQYGWAYGYGTVANGTGDEGSGRVTAFHPLPHFRRGSWQGGREVPDPELGWVMLNKTGGHPGAGLTRCAIRRLVADAAGELRIESELAHASAHGNGVRGRILKSSAGVVSEAVVHDGRAAMNVEAVSVQPGDHLDFVVDDLGDTSFDSFTWRIRVTQTANGSASRTWDSAADFGRRQSRSQLSAWAQLAQTLLLTNEFVFVD